MVDPDRLAPGRPAPPPLPRRPADAIVADWVGDAPLVSILCPTYQQVGFIDDALRGFLAQQTTFPFEILVRDDASQDGTADIVAGYAREYPGIVHAILEDRNRYPAIDPFSPLIVAARGRYLALCEGDDYWIDPTKLRVQAELLERTGAAASHHAQVEVENGVIVAPTDLSGRNLRDRSSVELMTSKKSLLTRTIMVRRDVVLEHAASGRLSSMWAVDAMITAIIGAHGGSRYADTLPAVYRVHPEGISTRLKGDDVVRLSRKSVDARNIAGYLEAAGFIGAADDHHAVAARNAAIATVALLVEAPRSLARGQFAPTGRRLRALLAATTRRTVPQQVRAVIAAVMRRRRGPGSG